MGGGSLHFPMPNIFSRNEFELWAARYEKGDGACPLVYEDSVLPIVEAEQAIIVEDTHQIDDGMWLEPAQVIHRE